MQDNDNVSDHGRLDCDVPRSSDLLRSLESKGENREHNREFTGTPGRAGRADWRGMRCTLPAIRSTESKLWIRAHHLAERLCSIPTRLGDIETEVESLVLLCGGMRLRVV